MMLMYDTSILNLTCTFIYTCVWGGGDSEGSGEIVECVAASKRWCLTDYTICTRHLMGQPLFYKATILLKKSCTFKLYLSHLTRVWFLSHMRTVVL